MKKSHKINFLKSSFQEKDSLNKQLRTVTHELETTKKALTKEEKHAQTLDLKLRATTKDLDVWKQKYEDSIVESKNDLLFERQDFF